jgi:trigger factor
MQISRNDIDALHTTLLITLEPTDYADAFEQELKKYRTQVQIKGFRKGMAPMTTIKKMYGRQLFADAINKSMQKVLFDYLEQEKIPYIASPLPTEGFKSNLDFDFSSYKSYQFSFDLGIVPEFDIKGIHPADEYNLYDVSISDKMIDEEVESFRKRAGKREEADADIQENDVLQIEALELDGKKMKEGGWKTDFMIRVADIADEKIKKSLIGKNNDFTFQFDIFKIEKDDPAYVEKYLLKKPEDDISEIGNLFEGKVTGITRLTPADLTPAFFEDFGDENVTDEESLREVIRKDLKQFADRQARMIMEKDIVDRVFGENHVDIPEQFLRRYLTEENQNLTPEQIDEAFPEFIRRTRLSLLREKLEHQFDVTVSENEIRRHFLDKYLQMLRNYPGIDTSFLDELVTKNMKNKQEVDKAKAEIAGNKLFGKIGDIVSHKAIPVTLEELNDIITKLNAKEEQAQD